MISKLKQFEIGRLLLRFFLASASVIGAALLYKYALSPLVLGFLELEESEIEPFGAFGSLVVTALVYYAYVKVVEKRPVSELAFQPLNLFLGGVSGVVLISISILILFSLGYYEVVEVRGYGAVFSMAGIILVFAAFEEFLFRGILFRILEQHTGTLFALSFVSLLFGGLHLFNEGAGLMTGLSVTLLGAFWCGIYVLTRNIWAVALNHVAWNFTIFVTGIPLSGQEEWRLNSPLESTYQGPTLLTGGEFGPEDSIITISLLFICLIFMYRFAKGKNLLV